MYFKAITEFIRKSQKSMKSNDQSIPMLIPIMTKKKKKHKPSII